MIVQILTSGEENFGWVLKHTDEYRHVHDIRVSDHPLEFYGNYDVGISFMHQHKVPAEQVNTHPWINFHPGPLPEYKGRNLCYHAIMNGERKFGVTVHYMDEDFDTGDIIEVFRFPIHEWWNAEDLSKKTIDISKKVFVEYLPIILENRIPQRRPNVGGAYYKKAKIADVVSLDKDVPLSRFIRAVYFPPFYPKVEIGGVTYKIVKDE